MKRMHSQKGTSLIEVLVSILLLSIGLLGLVGLQARTVQTTVGSENRANATLLTNELVSAMWISHSNVNNPTVSSAFANWQAVDSRALPSATYTIGAPAADGSVKVTVTWQAPVEIASNTFFTTVAIP